MVIKKFCDSKTCHTIGKRIRKYSRFSCGRFVIKKIGIFLLAYLNNKFSYFFDAKSSSHDIADLFESLDDPREKIKTIISKLLNTQSIELAKENGQKYSYGIIRIHEQGDGAPLHRDNANFEARQFAVSKFKSQLSCVFHIQRSESGGELLIYNKRWKVSDEKYRETGFGYSKKLVSDVIECCKIKPESGDLIILNPIHYHEILPVRGKLPRITLSLFVAFSNRFQKAVMWS